MSGQDSMLYDEENMYPQILKVVHEVRGIL